MSGGGGKASIQPSHTSPIPATAHRTITSLRKRVVAYAEIIKEPLSRRDHRAGGEKISTPLTVRIVSFIRAGRR
jgi:hypothetical protein